MPVEITPARTNTETITYKIIRIVCANHLGKLDIFQLVITVKKLLNSVQAVIKQNKTIQINTNIILIFVKV